MLENEIVLEGELRKDPVISKVALSNPRDKSESNFGFPNKSANEGLKLNMQSKVRIPETQFNNKQKYAERVNSKLLPLEHEMNSLKNGKILLRNKLSELHCNEILDKKPTLFKKSRNKRRLLENENKAHIENINKEVSKLEHEIRILQKVVELVEKKIRRTMKMLERKSRQEENKALKEILKSSDRTSTIKLNEVESRLDETISFIRVLAEKEISEGNTNEIADWMGSYEKRDAKVFHNLESGEAEQLQSLISNYSDVLVPKTETIPMGKANVEEEFDIELKDDAMQRLSKKRVKPYVIKSDMKSLLNDTLDEMEKCGVGSNNPPNFNPEIATPTFFVKNKHKWRMVHDYKRLNEESKDIIYPIPLIATIIESLKGKKYFSLIDLKSGYYQFRLSERAKNLCAVISPRGIFRFDCLPMGLKNAPPFFQRVMDRILKDGLNIYVFVYIDDIVVFS
ncbi:MAG TPA: reverse transcriptase family protein, partial [Chondromyces sp.]|nr:reverse transcriptase family protein [Chondromyces sp.]